MTVNEFIEALNTLKEEHPDLGDQPIRFCCPLYKSADDVGKDDKWYYEGSLQSTSFELEHWDGNGPDDPDDPELLIVNVGGLTVRPEKLKKWLTE